MKSRQENTMVNEGTADQEFTVVNSDGVPAVNENVMNVKTLEGCFNEKIDREWVILRHGRRQGSERDFDRDR